MRVGVDATSWSNPRGYGRFVRNAVGRLVESDPDTGYVLYLDEDAAAADGLPPGAEHLAVAVSAPGPSGRPASALVRLSRAVREARLDAFLFPSLYTYFPVLRTPTVVGVHDTIAGDLPALTLPGRRERVLWRVKETVAVRLADRVFTVSEASREALQRRFGLSAEQIAVVPEAPDPVFAPRPRPAVEAALRSVGLEPGEQFILYASGISPHKSVETLIDAYARPCRSRPRPLRLVLAGALGKEPYLSAEESVRRRLARLGLEEAVLLPGFVPDETLACLYSGAAAAVVTSLAEGFGLPAVEAAACGAPTVLSDLRAHRETLGEAALYFPPGDDRALAEALDRVLEDPALARRMAERGQEAVSRLSWDSAAQCLRELVTAAAGGR